MLSTIPQCNMSRSFLTRRKSRISSKKEIPESEQRLDVSFVLHGRHFLLEAIRGFWKISMGSGTYEYKHFIWVRSRKVK
jgi:hypothetical protein